MNNTLVITTFVRHSCLVVLGVWLAACTITEPLIYQGTTENSTPPASVYAYQSEEISRFSFIGTTHRIILAELWRARVIDLVTQQDIHTFLYPLGGSMDFSETDRAGSLFVQANHRTAEVWDLTTGKQLRSFKPVNSSSGSRNTRLSPDGKVLFFDNRMWDVATAEQKIELADDPPTNDAAFSADGRYFARGGLFDTQWFDLQTKQVEWSPIMLPVEAKQWFDLQTKQVEWLPNLLPNERKTSQLQFGRGNRLYRSYGWMDELAVSPLGDDKTRNTFDPRSGIACWALLPDHQVFAALTDGTLVWLDEDLKIKKQWHSELKVTACLPDTHNRIWLGTEKSGLLTLNLEQGRLKQVLPSTHWIKSVKLSADENYLGLLLKPYKSRVEIYKTEDLK